MSQPRFMFWVFLFKFMCNIKKCSKCGETKDLKFFHNDSSKSSGKCNHCKECRKIIPKLSENGTLFIFSKKRCSICKEIKLTDCFGKLKDSKLGFKPHCKTCDKLKREKIVFEIQEVKEKVCSGCNILFPKSQFNKDKYKKDGLSCKCKQCLKIKKVEYYNNNKEKVKASNYNYHINKTTTDPKYKLKRNISHLIRESFKRACGGGFVKNSKSLKILGCTITEFIEHLQSLFTEGMTLENHGNCEECWHIDHKIPISSAKTEEDIIRLNHYTNLQPLWRDDNLSKSNKLI